MLEQLFGSKARVKILRFLLADPDGQYYLRELARKLRIQLNSVRREVNNLEKMDLIKIATPETEKAGGQGKKSRAKVKKSQKKFYAININSILYPELRAMFMKAELLIENDLVSKIMKLGSVRLLILTGIFMGFDDYPTDVLIVGNVNRSKLAKIMKRYEKELNHPINYTVFSKQEYKYRREITDRFLFDILESNKIVAHDSIH
ncbi:MAG: hypothetical protein COT81_05545 [Candidatus Buchananbacteria bacterium CG10_big_fil_rev_8_21_14_0_10_42_9]|uniref:HTH arsR-type domain-containing protein n=1 Tax=Candidatus Buchananbacteria bacterium CG10_big_fil_rev_8_21_14_0_10_42_9 TaxID=1974526 RepID=A0A2H0W1X7_9BACT|nr:MAG: hypothetical protein COT81_05545 [Candidatus Buchananbacteria bacterium CG10_big_fil_rev_8_21_14_0_10_42_9]